MKTKNIERYLESFGKYVIKQSRTNLSKAKKNLTRDLYNSLKFTVKKKKNGFSVNFFMADYGTFVDKGVSGTKQARSFRNYNGKTKKSPYRFGTGSSKVGKAQGGMSGIMAKWVKKRNFQWRDKETGRFMSRKSMGYIIARSIYSKGIQGISFFQRPLELGLKRFGKELLINVRKDVVNILRQSIN
tara:strand:- start:130 stop:687 length:558 start_codon:yes stop_codon:yes gene_type:complete